jgi:hypothetical protein
VKLLTIGNPKIEKSKKFGFLTAILHLSPHTLSGYNVCPMATKGCASACLNTAGRGGMFAGCKTADLTGSEMVERIRNGLLENRIQAARLRRTKMVAENRKDFMAQLVTEIRNFVRLAKKSELTPVIRLNGTSDLRWEIYKLTVDSVEYDNIMSVFSDIQFYDYTKIPNRRNLPANYHLTFSLAEDNDVFALSAIQNGMNVAVVFRTPNFPTEFMGLPVVDGDISDLRFLDRSGSVVGLKAKGKAKKDTSGFVREVA